MNSIAAEERAEATDGRPVKGGTVSWACYPGFPPSTIFPFTPPERIGTRNLFEFQMLMYRPLYWLGKDGQPGVDYDLSLAEPPETDWSRRADDKILDDELGRAIQEATDTLPEGYREVFLLKDVEGLSYEEISEMLGISIPAVKSRLHRARLALREAIDAFYKEV